MLIPIFSSEMCLFPFYQVVEISFCILLLLAGRNFVVLECPVLFALFNPVSIYFFYNFFPA